MLILDFSCHCLSGLPFGLFSHSACIAQKAHVLCIVRGASIDPMAFVRKAYKAWA